MSPAELYSELVGLGLSPGTVRQYLATIVAAEGWFAVHGWELATATPEQVASYVLTKPATFASRNLLRAAFRHYWSACGHPRPPVRAVRVPPKPAMVCKALDAGPARVLAAAARSRGDRQGLAVLLGMYQGMRREEIAALPWAGFDGRGWMRVIGKGEKERTIPVHPVVSTALEGWPRSGLYVFPGRFGGSADPATIWAWVHQVAEEAGVGLVRTHWLRHTCLATANDNTGDLRSVQHFAGHSRPETTAGYSRATRNSLVRAVMSLDY